MALLGRAVAPSGDALRRDCLPAGAGMYPPKMLQEIMGHASITTTLDLYGDLCPGDMDRYADRLDSLDSAAGITDPARIRPDDDEDRRDAE
jgi:integrase